MREMKVLQVAFALAPVGPDAVGGSEQILSSLDASLTAEGHQSIVVAQQGSCSTGQLLPTPVPASLDAADRAQALADHARNVAAAVARWSPDIVHMHGLDFHACLPPPGPPVLVTLHLPPGWYPAEALQPRRPHTWLHAVSASQHAACPPSPQLLPPIPNGVPVDALQARLRRRNLALCLGRICPEKNQHVALDAGSEAGLPVLLGGKVFGYADHERYWQDAIAPRLLRHGHRFLGALGLGRKRRLLSAARCLLVPSLAPETSSLVAMEAIACGTPVIAFGSGALPEVIADGITGFIVRDAREMALAMRNLGRIDAEVCRAHARRHFDAAKMAAAYFARYTALLQHVGGAHAGAA